MITPSQAKHIMANWRKVCLHDEFPDKEVGLAEMWVPRESLKSAGIALADLHSEGGGIYVGWTDVVGHNRAPTFSVRETERRAAMTHAQWEKYKQEAQQGMEVGG